METWRSIPEFPNYEVSNHGNVANLVTGHIMAQNMNQYDVPFVGLWDGGMQFKRSVPLLVARAFISQPYPAYDTPINLDGDRWNNHVNNLTWRPRWFAVKYNRQFRYEYRNRIHFQIEDTGSGEISENSLECAKRYGLLEDEIVHAINNRTYVWPTYQQFKALGY